MLVMSDGVMTEGTMHFSYRQHYVCFDWGWAGSLPVLSLFSCYVDLIGYCLRNQGLDMSRIIMCAAVAFWSSISCSKDSCYTLLGHLLLTLL